MLRRASLLALLCLLALPVVLAAPPFAVETYGSLGIQYPKISYYEIGKPFDLHFHVFNATGVNVTNGTYNCSFHFYNYTNEHLFKVAKMDWDGNEFEQEGIILNETGDYAYITYCSGGGIGGYVSGNIIITQTGKQDDSQDTTLAAVLVLIPFFIVLVLFGAAYLYRGDEEHKTLVFFLHLAGFFTALASIGYGVFTATRFYGYQQLSESLASFLWIYAILLGVIVAYWFIYYMVLALEKARGKREGRE